MEPLLTFFAQYPREITALVVFVLVIAVTAGIWFNLPARRERRNINRAIRRLGVKILSDVKLPDGVDGEIYLDYLVLTPEDIKVISVKRYPGLIYGGEQLQDWTQVINNRNHHFPNPLYEMKLKIMAVKAVVPNVPINGLTLFCDDSRFPTHKPEGVLNVRDIVAKPDKTSIPTDLLNGWSVLSNS
jgi:hypothetical protein